MEATQRKFTSYESIHHTLAFKVTMSVTMSVMTRDTQ